MFMASTSHNPFLTCASTLHPTKWDVFLSFRGKDTRYIFTDHLYDSLDRTGIRTFRDVPGLRSGEVISDGLLQAIQESKMYVVVLSENYASSRWCLDELVEILRCCESMDRLVLPVFYNIKASVVRHQIGSFSQAFEEHKNRFDGNRLDKWRHTLMKVADFSGYEVHRNKSQAEVINEIVDRVLHEVNPGTLDVATYQVGLDSRVGDIATLLSNATAPVTKIGIYGMGGIGKTTLAKAVYNQNYRSFKGSCFLENVREASQTKKGMTCLQQKLVNDVLKCNNITIDNADQGIEIIRARICSIEILIVIDDLDSRMPLDFLIGPFASGSTIIITTRYEDLLDSIKIDAKYKVNELDDVESRQLFCQHAFGGDDRMPKTFIKLSKEILKCAGGLPLALKVCGSALFNESEEGWGCFIDKLRRLSITDVEEILLISFNALVDPMLKDIFLDIACFFIGQEKEEVVKIMETRYTYVSYNIDILKKRCLLTINHGRCMMHDLILGMGRKIACNNSPNVFDKHTRLWVSEDIQEMLKEHKGVKEIQGISDFNIYLEETQLNMALERLRTAAAEKGWQITITSNLSGSFVPTKYLKQKLIKGTKAIEGISDFDICLEDSLIQESVPTPNLPESCIDSLKSLKRLLSGYQQKFDQLALPSTFNKVATGTEAIEGISDYDIYSEDSLIQESVTTSYLPVSYIDTFKNFKSLRSGYLQKLDQLAWPGIFDKLVTVFENLKTLHMSNCVDLTTTPDFSRFSCLETLNFKSCEGLKEVHMSIGNLARLVSLNLQGCKNLKSLPDSICNLRALKTLSIGDCSNLEELPMNLGKIKSLEELNAEWLIICKLPPSIGHLSKLIKLNLSFCRNLKTLPDSICNLRSLKILNISWCSRLKVSSIVLGNLDSLVELKAETLPTVSKILLFKHRTSEVATRLY